MLTVMLDRSVWDRLYKCLERGNVDPPLSENNLIKLDRLLQKEKIGVVSCSINEIESYIIREPSKELEIEKLWLEKKVNEYNCQTYTSTFYSNDINSLSNVRSIVGDQGDVDISPHEIKKLIVDYGISCKKKRDVVMLIIAEKMNVDLFIHHNPKDYERDNTIKKLLKEKISRSKIVPLVDAVHEIKAFQTNGAE